MNFLFKAIVFVSIADGKRDVALKVRQPRVMYEQNGREWPEGHTFEACRESYNGNIGNNADCIAGCANNQIHPSACADGYQLEIGPFVSNNPTWGLLCQTYCFEKAIGNCQNADDAVKRLKRGPPNIPEIVYNLTCSGEKWTDTEFVLP